MSLYYSYLISANKYFFNFCHCIFILFFYTERILKLQKRRTSYILRKKNVKNFKRNVISKVWFIDTIMIYKVNNIYSL